MQIAKGYFQDRAVLLLLGVNLFAVVAISIIMGLRLTSISSESYFIQYRPNFGEAVYKTGGVYNLLLFIGFAVLVVLFHSFLSYKAYPLKKQLSVILLSMSVFLIALALIVGNSLLALR